MSWQVDPSHTSITFQARHMMVAKVRGEFEGFQSNIDFDPNAPEDTSVYVEVETGSVNTRDQKRDAHLRSPDFFDVENFPKMVFRSREVRRSSANKGQLIGDLTIKDVTRPVTLDVTYSGVLKNPWGAEQAGFSANGKLNRKDWGLNWNMALEAGGWLVGDEINIDIDLELVKVTEQAAETA